MSVIRNARRDRFTITPNATLRDERLSLQAKGLLALMLSFPDDWRYSMEHVMRHSTNGRDSHRRATRELVDAGYIERVPRQGDDGRMIGQEWIVSDTPERREHRRTGNPADGEPDTTKTERSTKTEPTKNTHQSSSAPRNGQPLAPTGAARRNGKGRSGPTTEELERVVSAYNDHRGGLPAVKVLNASRRRKIGRAIRDLGSVSEVAAAVSVAAAEAAADPFWLRKGYGFDNLLAEDRFVQKAETAMNRGTTDRDADAGARIADMVEP